MFIVYQYVTEWLTCPLWEREIEGSNPSVLKFFFEYVRGCIAQLVERWPFKPRVLGSSPSAPKKYEKVAEWLRRQTVNLLEIPSQVRILFFSFFFAPFI